MSAPASAAPELPGGSLDQGFTVRFLKIHPGSDDDPLFLQVFTTRLTKRPRYEAVSYVWGDTSQKTWIEVHQSSTSNFEGDEQPVSISITLSCLAALKRLRRDVTTTPRVVWIDSICINQSKVDERNHQLTLMWRIYKGASRVVVYLGEGDAGSDEAMDWIRENDEPSDYGQRGMMTLIPEPNPATMSALFRRPWFTRVWVLQEVAMAREAVVYCGDKATNWESFREFVRANQSSSWIVDVPYIVRAGNRGTDISTDAAEKLLLKELIRTRQCQATDPRDKLFALLPTLWSIRQESEIDDFREHEDNVFSSIADYSLSPSQVFTNLAAYLIQGLGPDVLRSVVGVSCLSGLPSWVPDWTIPGFVRGCDLDRLIGTSGPWAGLQRPPSTIEDNKHLAKLREGHGWSVLETLDQRGNERFELHGKGLVIGEIDVVGDLCEVDKNDFPISQWQSLEYSNRARLKIPEEKRVRYDGAQESEDQSADKLSLFERLIVMDHVVTIPAGVTKAVEAFLRFERFRPRKRKNASDSSSSSESLISSSSGESDGDPPTFRTQYHRETLEPLSSNMATQEQTQLSQDTKKTSSKSDWMRSRFKGKWSQQLAELKIGIGNSALTRTRLRNSPTKSLRDCARTVYDQGQSTNIQAQTMLDVCDRRKLFITKTGFLGLGPENISIGDSVCILENSVVPFVTSLLENDAHWAIDSGTKRMKLIGDCYVLGAMEGQLCKNERDMESIVFE
jgi:hypothetical protein